MSTFAKTIMTFGLCLSLAACGGMSFNTPVYVKRENLNLVEPAPLDLEPIAWDVQVIDGKSYYILDTKGYSALSNNSEKLQNFIKAQKDIIQKQKEYYEKPIKN